MTPWCSMLWLVFGEAVASVCDSVYHLVKVADEIN